MKLSVLERIVLLNDLFPERADFIGVSAMTPIRNGYNNKCVTLD